MGQLSIRVSSWQLCLVKIGLKLSLGCFQCFIAVSLSAPPGQLKSKKFNYFFMNIFSQFWLRFLQKCKIMFRWHFWQYMRYWRNSNLFQIAIKLRWKQMFLRTPNATKQNINLHIKTGNCGLRPTYSIDIHVLLLEFNVRNNCRWIAAAVRAQFYRLHRPNKQVT